MQTRKADPEDAPQIHELICSLTQDGTLLPRSLQEIARNIDTFTVAVTEQGEFAGCAALHVYGQHLAEVRSIVVRPNVQGHGAGGMLVESLLAEADTKGIRCVCLFTRIPQFFEHFHFHKAEHAALRDKVMKDCVKCPRRNACDEIAMTIGVLPQYQGLPMPAWLQAPAVHGLVPLHA